MIPLKKACGMLLYSWSQLQHKSVARTLQGSSQAPAITDSLLSMCAWRTVSHTIHVPVEGSELE